MDTKLKFTGGEPDMTEEAFLRTQNSTRLFIHALGDALGRLGISTSDPYIVQGCSATVASSKLTVTAGYIYLGGEIVQVDAQTDVPLGAGETTWIYQVQTTYEAAGDKVYANSISRQTYEKKRGVLTGVVSVSAGELEYNGNRLGNVIGDYIDSPTTSKKGTVEKATTAEVQAATANKYLDASNIRDLIATTSRPGIQENATDTEAKALSATDKTITPSNLAAINGGLITEIIDIGDWDMDANQLKSVSTGITGADIIKIRSIDIIIRNDDGSAIHMLNTYTSATDLVQGGIGGWLDIGTVGLARRTGGIFDSTSFNSTSYNRGWIKITREP